MEPLVVKDRVILEQFDYNDPKNLGRPLYWSLDNHIIAIEQMICADEVEIAMQMFEQVPAWYRENYPQELTYLKNTLFKNLYDPYDYAADPDEAGWTKEDAPQSLQQIILELRLTAKVILFLTCCSPLAQSYKAY